MSDLRKIIKIEYEGPKDSQGLPHGEGYMDYFADEDHVPYPEYPDLHKYYKEVGEMVYKGHFEHGVRQGEGKISILGLNPSSADQYSWYSEGDYDCGRLVHPEHPDGSWRQGLHQKMWHELFVGTWKDDLPLETTHWLGMPSERDLEIIRTTCKDVLATTLISTKKS